MTLQIPHQEVGEVGRVVIVLAAGKLAAQLVPLALLPARRRHRCPRGAAIAHPPLPHHPCSCVPSGGPQEMPWRPALPGKSLLPSGAGNADRRLVKVGCGRQLPVESQRCAPRCALPPPGGRAGGLTPLLNAPLTLVCRASLGWRLQQCWLCCCSRDMSTRWASLAAYGAARAERGWWPLMRFAPCSLTSATASPTSASR